MRTVCISDTHMRHDRIAIPQCDLLVHAGDVTRHGSRDELEEFVAWFARQPATHKLFVAGNHDRCCEADPAGTRKLAARHGIEYLVDDQAEIEGRTIWGSPITPTFRNMAYNRDRGTPIREHWSRIPSGLDLLVTHGPPKGLGDRMVLGLHVGCEDLRRAVQTAEPRFHLFGHIHEASGEYRLPGCTTRFVNAASSRLLWGVRAPVVLTL